MEENQEIVGVGSLVGVLGFPWEGDSNEGGKTFLLQRSSAEETVRSSRSSRLQVTSGRHRLEVSARRSPGAESRSASTHRPQTQPRCAGSFWRSSSCPACTAAAERKEEEHREGRV